METTETLSAKIIKQKIQANKDVVLIDTLSGASFCAKHIPGSINIPADKIKETVELILPDKNQVLIPYCVNSTCNKSIRATQILTELGYKKVMRYSEGLAGWRKEGYVLAGTGEAVTDDCS